MTKKQIEEKKTESTVIRRVRKENQFAQISNDLINNKGLSYKALGILTYILAKPDDWQVYMSDLERETDGEKSVRNGLNELIEKKFVQRYRVFNKKNGKVHHWETLVSETPYEDDELISSVKETYAYDEEGNIIYQKVTLGTFERYVPIVVNREVSLVSQKGNVEKIEKEITTLPKPTSRKPTSRKRSTTNTNITNTDFSTNTKSSNTSSKGDKSPLVVFFEENICELRKTTLPKFQAYEKKYDHEFIKAIIKYGALTNGSSYNWFQVVIEDYISNNMVTAEDVERDIKNWREKGKKGKIDSIKQKEEKKQKSIEAHKREMAGYDALDAMVESDLPEVTYDTANGEVVEGLKEIIKSNLSETMFNTWIDPYKFIKVGNKIVMEVPTAFTVNIIEKRYYELIEKCLRAMGKEEILVVTIKKY